MRRRLESVVGLGRFAGQRSSTGGRAGRAAIGAKRTNLNLDTRDQVRALADQLPPAQLVAVEALPRSMLGPLARKLASAEIDSERPTGEQRRAIEKAVEWSKNNQPLPMAEALAGFGLTSSARERLTRTPLDQPRTVMRDG